ncbi:MAG: ABC transporter ATP-binding protein [Clostridiales bacterium]|nr:ABC transporter ATP-binding protein [Clostridiales bacterium]
MLEIKNAVLGYRGKQKNKIVLDGLSFSLAPGELLCILGANGVGKTTMYRTVLGFLPLLGGSILIDGEDISGLTRERLAKRIAYVPQYHSPPFPYTVFDVVLMGRSAHLQQFATPGKADEEITCEMLERMGILSLKDEIYTEISGGERQLVLIARALAQQSSYILMDEPASNLDYGNQMRMLQTIRELAEQGIGVCFTSHYPTHAFLTEASVLAIEGRDRARKGSAREIITEPLLREMYGLDAEIRPVADRDGREHASILIHMETSCM